MDTSAAAAITFLKNLINQGENPNTLGSYSTAVRKVLAATHGDAWPGIDLATLDVAMHVDNFTLESQLEPASVAVYAARFRSAVKRFLRHVNGQDAGFEAQTPTSMLEYPYPIREGLVTSFRLPVDLTKDEAERLGAFFLSLSRG